LVFTAWASAARGREGPWAPWLTWVFIDGTDKVEGGLVVLFFGLVFTVETPPSP